jgi:CRP-like cAMP-binding protein
MQQLIHFINQYTKLSADAIKALEDKVKFESFKKNDFVLRQGTRTTKVWFITSGLIRKFYVNEGKEITSWIHSENEMFTSMHSYFQKNLHRKTYKQLKILM